MTQSLQYNFERAKINMFDFHWWFYHRFQKLIYVQRNGNNFLTNLMNHLGNWNKCFYPKVSKQILFCFFQVMITYQCAWGIHPSANLRWWFFSKCPLLFLMMVSSKTILSRERLFWSVPKTCQVSKIWRIFIILNEIG